MANDKNKKDYNIAQDKSFKRQISNINNLISQANMNIYGTDRTSDVDDLNKKFQSILSNQLDGLTNRDNEDITSFLGNLVSSDNKSTAISDMLNNQFMNMGFGDDYSTVQSFIYEAYKNRLLEQSDLHEVSSQLIELSEAILITRDAIVSADVVDGRMNRSLSLDNIDEDDASDAITAIENLEERFKLLNKIKNFIIPKTLEYGEYYVYIIPYSKIFDSFMKAKESNLNGHYTFHESTLMESFDEKSLNTTKIKSNNDDDINYFIEKAYDEYTAQEKTKYTDPDNNIEYKIIDKKDFAKDMKNMLSNISVSNDDIPLPILDEGFNSIGELKTIMEQVTTEKSQNSDNLFDRIAKSKMTPDGITFSSTTKSSKKDKNEFSDIEDCYIRMIDPTRIIPLKIMNTVIGYYYIQDEDITPLAGAISNTLYYSKFDQHRKEGTVIDAIASRVVKSFNRDFLKDNIKFKECIVDCINYYNINEKRLKFQFIPAEYIQTFKIDEDVDGNGTSMIKKSLFYAKLYLMLLLFKIMTIILNSNDQKVNYIKQSGIDKNVANKVQEIARIKQSRQINITDLFSYTTLINKVGNGTEMYVPTGRSGERPIETEILSGQDVQLNSELLEMLKNSYILGTGVPAAIVNYLNEADFAKTVEQNNSKFNGRVVNYQLDFNPDITSLYKKLMKWSTNVPEHIIDNFEFTLQPPKMTATNTKSEMIGSVTSIMDFITGIWFDDPNQAVNPNEVQDQIREFKKIYVKDQLPMLNIDSIEKMIEKSKINVMDKKLKPDPVNGDNGDDDGLLTDDEINDTLDES